MRYGSMLIVGSVAVASALATAVAIRPEAVSEDTPPMDRLLDEIGPLDLERVALEEEEEEPEIINPEWDLPATRNDRVDFWIDFLRGPNSEHTRLWLERSGRYIPMIRAELRSRGMPEDLIYLAMIESGFSPRAVSSASAVGLWQFIAATGQRYGLRITQHVDERRDPVKATRAALDYLQDLHQRFGSWYLAAAAYNSGENRVDRILRQRAGGRRGDDALFWRIAPYLPRETRDYVPLMLAAGFIAKNPEEYGFTDLEYHDPLRYDEVEVPGSTSLGLVASAAETDEEAIRELNPHLVRGATPPGGSYSVRVPRGAAELYAANIDRVLEEERERLALVAAASITHIVRRGETLSHIARRYGVSVQSIQRENNVTNPRRIQIGQRLQIPGAGDAAHQPAEVAWHEYRVRRGDSLWAIARRYGVTVKELQSWNNLGSRSLIRPGQVLRIQA
ncbi:MAG TPA: LysM peptidoglycan-binding domain-containing protein [Longimicrobiales bacterium]|nr:LysM peptidoglycan-binding domain-containing protein [Longimicrobiales bacterium]